MLVKIQQLIDDAKCDETIRSLRWPVGVHCPHGGFHWVTKGGFHTNQPARQRYVCRRASRRNRLKAKRGRGTLEIEKPPVLGMIQRTGQLIIEMLPNVQQKTIQPLIQAHVQAGTLI